MSEITAIASATSQPADLLAQNTSGILSSPSPVSPPVEDVVRFEGILETPAKVETAPLNNAQPTVSSTGSETGLGDVILNGIERMSSTYQDKVDAVNSSLTATNEQGLQTKDLMQLQFELTQMTLLQDLTAKVADKTSQGIQTLFKNQ